MILLTNWLLPIKMQDELLKVDLYSKVNPSLLSEVVELILTKPSINKSLVCNNNLKIMKSQDFADVYFYLALQDIPKVLLKTNKTSENKSKIYY